ncbi:hypothetical protein FNV43_RR11547 [Rhamnella rubrinervis]|uniref:Homeobox domain-containing protein n=1 Tax=Rhamnella rubrinervis TaxID=2594499 RepID=A0A8K0H6L1_9ROSA|nr:hypothetical protein FNV43_RR11547 [Rhamnella rubrinervis]
MTSRLSNVSNQKYDLLTPYPGDHKFASYPKPPFDPGNMMTYLNEASPAGSYSMILPGSSPSSNNCVDSIEARNEMMFIPPFGDPVSGSVNGDPLAVPRTQLSGALDSENNIQYQGLSLSLATQIPSAVSLPMFQNQGPNPNLSSVLNTCLPISVNDAISCKGNGSNQSGELRNVEYLTFGSFGGSHNTVKAEAFYNPLCSVSSREMHIEQYAFEPSGVSHNILNTKYLKASQQLLDEVVNLRKALKQPGLNKQGLVQMDLENKRTKLFSMLDEVSSLPASFSITGISGPGAAEPYTALALRTISRHFRCLRDAISGQIQVIQRSLGEQGTTANGQGEAIPRLRYVDQQLRQQKAIQQLGIMRNAWRPQRGFQKALFQSFVLGCLSIFFTRIYPKDSEKVMLARQTGLTKNQVANWFINARVRLWKPMVEEMYKEEFSDSELNSKLSENTLNEQSELQRSAADSVDPGQVQDLKAESFHEGNNIRDSGMTRLQGDQMSFYMDEAVRRNQNGDRNPMVVTSAAYDMPPEFGSFAVGSQVSLSLELRHCESDGFSTSGVGSHIRGNDAAAAATLDYHCVDPGQQQCRFSNPHLLHDFVV